MAMIVRRCFLSTVAAAVVLAVLAMASPSYAQNPPSERELRIYAGLHAAAANGDVAEIEKLIADGENPNIQDSHSRTPLLVAAFQRKAAAAQALIRLGANAKAHDTDGYDILAIATLNNDPEMLKVGLAGGADAKATTGFDDGSALITAAHLGFVEIVRALIEGHAILDHTNARGWTALITAVVLGNGDSNHTATVDALVKAGADVTIKDRDGKSALDYARSRGYSEMIHSMETAVRRRS
jgi:hypothetical protein